MDRYLGDPGGHRVQARIAALAAQLCSTPMALVSIVDRDRIWLLATHGMEVGRHIARDDGLCVSAITGDAPYLLEDALADPTAADNGFVREHRIRFYAAAPIITPDGHRLGTVAVMDTEVRSASAEQLAGLEDAAAIVMEILEAQQTSLDSLRLERRRRDAAEYARDDARRDRDAAQSARDAARRDRNDARLDHRDAQVARDDARRDRDEAWLDLDNALRNRDSAEHERDLVEEYAWVLQQTLLPPILPKPEGISVAACYHPASPRRVGGDFYDIFSLGDGRWVFFIGDVEGHGVEAAVATSLIRYTLRSTAAHYRDLTHALAELNSVLLRELEPRRFCTALLGSLEPSADGSGFDVTIATGGHPPALLLDPDSGTAERVRSRKGMLLGATPRAVFDECRVHLLPGQKLVLYTDGIIEAWHADPPFDEDSLAAFASNRSGLSVAGLIDELTTLIPKLRPDDDIAVLAIGVD